MWWLAWLSLSLASPAEISAERCAEAKAYSAARRGVSLLVLVDGQVVCADPAEGPERAYELASGTKSLSGLLAVALAQRGMLDLDEPVSATLTEWASDKNKREITVRQLLTLTSGLQSKVLGRESWEESIALPSVAEPGSIFRYGSGPFQVFGALVLRKTGRDPTELLEEYVFSPIGLDVYRWNRTRDGHPTMAYGVALTAREWAKIGELVRNRGRYGQTQVLSAALVDEMLSPAKGAPWYGLSWWRLGALGDLREELPILARLPSRAPGWLPDDLVMAAGAGDQRLYVSAEEHLVVVRQADGILSALAGRGSGFSDLELLGILLGDPR